jgi:hypothetical protein
LLFRHILEDSAMDHLRILVVDDRLDAADSLAILLGVLFRSGQEGLLDVSFKLPEQDSNLKPSS